MKWKDGIRLAIFHILILLKLHYLLVFIRHILPTISGDNAYYPKNYVFNEPEELEINRNRYNESHELYNEFKERRYQYDGRLDIRIVASDRQMGYLMQVVGFLTNSFSRHETIPHISICNTANHVFEELQPFQGVFPIHNITGSRNVTFNLDERISKETADYWKCLNVSTNARYILLLEDDAPVVPKFSDLIENVLFQLEKRPDIDYVKLFHPKNLRKIPSIPMAISVSLGTILVLQLLVFRRFLLGLLLITTIVLYLDVRSYSSEFFSDLRFAITGSVYFTSPESCCTQAVVFRSSSAGKIVDDLSQIPSFDGKAKDHLLDESSFVGRQTDSNLVVHIGAYYSIVRGRQYISKPTKIRKRKTTKKSTG